MSHFPNCFLNFLNAFPYAENGPQLITKSKDDQPKNVTGNLKLRFKVGFKKNSKYYWICDNMVSMGSSH